jgi:beta-galactosidase
MRKPPAILLSLLLFAILFSVSLLATQNSTKPSAPPPDKNQIPGLVLGAAWYPEHWPEDRWAKDLTLMQAAGINMVRVGEFAWSRMEPSEGQFDFAWLERAIALAGKHHIKVVVGTPTAAPPAWLTQKYPDTLAIWDNGKRATHGNRGHYRPTSKRYLQFCRRVAEEMAQRFGHNSNVIGWQIDNEYGPVSYDEDTQRQFQTYLRAKFKTLDELNRHWTTDYWSQTYDNWEEIPIPIGYHNPGLMLEWRRFITETIRNFQQNQITAIRAHADPAQFITHNFMGFNNGFDHYVVSQDLDFASWDHYVGSGHLDPLGAGQTHDLTRGFKRKNFWVMETQPGTVNWAGVNNALDRGEVRRMAWESVGHGADAVAYWQWRSALGGQEQYHGSLVGSDGKPRPIYEEVAHIGRDFDKVSSLLQGTSPSPVTAILFDYDSRWAIDFQRHHKDFDSVNYLNTLYRPLRVATQDIDIVHPSAPLSQYKLVIAPALNILSDERAKHLLEYVNGGGHLVLGTRTGMKDEFNALRSERQPGLALSRLLGGDVMEYYPLEKSIPVSGKLVNGEATVWAEWLEVNDSQTEVLLRFEKSNGWLDGQPAVITRPVGKGRITYLGGQFDANVTSALVGWLVKDAGIHPALGPVPEGVEVCRRVGKSKEVFIVINHTVQPQSIALPREMRDLLRNANPSKTLSLPSGEVAVVTE